MAYSVGQGFYTTAANNRAGRKAKAIIDDFAQEWDLDMMNQIAGIEGWATGDAFFNTVPADDEIGIAGFYNIPVSSIIQVHTDKALRRFIIII